MFCRQKYVFSFLQTVLQVAILQKKHRIYPTLKQIPKISRTLAAAMSLAVLTSKYVILYNLFAHCRRKIYNVTFAMLIFRENCLRIHKNFVSFFEGFSESVKKT